MKTKIEVTKNEDGSVSATAHFTMGSGSYFATGLGRSETVALKDLAQNLVKNYLEVLKSNERLDRSLKKIESLTEVAR